MNKYSYHLTCLGVVALQSILPQGCFAAPVQQKVKSKVEHQNALRAALTPQQFVPVNKNIVSQHALYNAHDSSEHSTHSHKRKCSYVVITADDINHASCKSKRGLVLDKPNTIYRLCENVNWKATSSDSAAITVAADGISLDLHGHTIKQCNTSFANNHGIEVESDVAFVDIYDGTLRQFSRAAIAVRDGVSCLSIDNISIQESSYDGQFLITFPVLGDVPFAGGIAVVGTADNPADTISISNCTFCDNGIVDGLFASGVDIGAIMTVYANNLTIKNIQVDTLYGNNFSSGVSCALGSGLYLGNLTASNIMGNREAISVALTLFDNSIIEDVHATNVTLINDENAPQTLNPAGAEGVKYTSTENFVLRRATFENLEVKSSVPVDHTVFTMTCNGVGISSFDTPSRNGLIQDVTTIGVHSDGALLPANNVRACGYSMDGVENVKFENCFVSDVSISIGHAFGFGSKLVSDNPFRNPRVSFVNCVAQNIEVTGSAGYAAGFLLSADQEEMIGCTADRIIDNRANPKAYGIILDAFSTGEANRCIIRNNTLVNCSTYGLFDNTVAKNSIITGNYAALNGPGGAGPNYFGLNVNVPLVLWKPYLTSVAPATPSAYANLDIQN